MKVLIACEESQKVCIEMRKLGHEAYSCDILEPSGGHPEWHIKGDALQYINGGCRFLTLDGKQHFINGKWDLLIAHPPCTYLSNVATRSHSLKSHTIEQINTRTLKRIEAMIFFMAFANADCDHIAIENPVGVMNTAYRKPDQIVHPYYFATDTTDKENYVTKATCLWLKGLPQLTYNEIEKPDNSLIFGGYYSSGKKRTWEDVNHNAKQRSKTFLGIAKAIAKQWAGTNGEAKK